MAGPHGGQQQPGATSSLSSTGSSARLFILVALALLGLGGLVLTLGRAGRPAHRH